jgi:LDH2 family malate/lactate/ureidoglycolate dehydrogenase
MADMRLIAPEPLQALAERIFVAAGTPADLAAQVARHLVNANLSGHDSHGVLRIPSYLRQIEQGGLHPAARPEVVQEWPAAAVVDAHRGFGHVAAGFALDLAMRKAETAGVGAVSIRRCGHIGRLGDYSETAAARGYVALLMSGSAGPNSGHAAPFGGAARHLGTNPWSLGVPAAPQPVIVDFATTVVAEGKIQVARAKHQPLPPGCIVDKEGQPTTNAEDFYAGGMILPAGGHKGYGLSLVAALLGAGLTASPAASQPSSSPAAGAPAETRPPASAGRGGGVVVLALNPRAFAAPDAFAGTMDSMTQAVKAVAPAPGFEEVLLPGEPEAKSRAERRARGIPIPADTWDALAEAAGRFDIPMPEAGAG